MTGKCMGFILTLGTITTIGILGCRNSSATSQVSGDNATTSASAVSASGKVNVTVSGDGFVPSSITAKQGEPLTLEFTRVSDKTCATQVVFPELNVTKDLPLNGPVRIEVPTQTARKLTFQCGMGMYKSSVVVL